MRIKNISVGRTRWVVSASIALLWSLSAISPTSARWMVTAVDVPVDRLLQNTRLYIQKNPKDPQGYYVLGRVNSLAFAQETKTLQINQRTKEPLPGFLPWESILVKRAKQGPLSKQSRQYLIESIRNYHRATELAPDRAIAFLGLGWMLESGAAWSASLGPVPLNPKGGGGANAWKQSAIDAYRTAYKLASAADLQRRGLGPGADSAVSLEAGEGILRLIAGRKSDLDAAEIETIESTVQKLKAAPMAVTPIIFPLDQARSMENLLADNLTVRFDMAGDGEPELWPWVKPDAGILVWDPKRTGRVESGRQLFGSVTWWMAWRHGYEPLAALDDNLDGMLRGRELDCLAVWRDRNSNGVSEPGEVIPIRKADVRAIAVEAVQQNQIFANPHGIELTNGRTLPTYDWTPTEVKPLALASAEPAERLRNRRK